MQLQIRVHPTEINLTNRCYIHHTIQTRISKYLLHRHFVYHYVSFLFVHVFVFEITIAYSASYCHGTGNDCLFTMTTPRGRLATPASTAAAAATAAATSAAAASAPVRRLLRLLSRDNSQMA